MAHGKKAVLNHPIIVAHPYLGMQRRETGVVYRDIAKLRLPVVGWVGPLDCLVLHEPSDSGVNVSMLSFLAAVPANDLRARGPAVLKDPVDVLLALYDGGVVDAHEANTLSVITWGVPR